ncbi:MAG: M48 family metalloprotease [Planctomycetota bacterium]
MSELNPPATEDPAGAADAAASSAAAPTPEEAADAKRYAQASLRLTVVDMVVDVAVLVAVALLVGPWLDAWLGAWAPLSGERSLLRVAALGGSITLLHTLASLPISFYGGYVVEHRFGLSTQSIGRWLKSWLKKSALALALLVAMYTGLYAIIWWAGGWWWAVAAAAFFLVSAVLGQLLPVVILPLFQKTDPLPADACTDRMQEMAQRAGITIDGVYRLEMSADTKKANAMLAGIGATRRVLLGDTLIEEFTPAEVEIVFAHELGHQVHRHLPKMLVFTAAASLAGFWLCQQGVAVWSGDSDPRQWSPATLPVLLLLLTTFSMLMGPLMNLLSRHFERQADRYAAAATADLPAFRSAFLKLARMNKAELEPGRIEEFLLHSHPSISERLRLVGADAEAPVPGR